MAKPSLFQTLFNQPSRSYIDPYSTDSHLYTGRTTAGEKRASLDFKNGRNNSKNSLISLPPDSALIDFPTMSDGRPSRPSSFAEPSSSYPPIRRRSVDINPNDGDVENRRARSPQPSTSSSSVRSSRKRRSRTYDMPLDAGQPSQEHVPQSDIHTKPEPLRHGPSAAGKSLPLASILEASQDGRKSSDEEDDVFFTPPSSPPSSPGSHGKVLAMPSPPKVIVTLSPSTPPVPRRQISREAARASLVMSVSSLALSEQTVIITPPRSRKDSKSSAVSTSSRASGTDTNVSSPSIFSRAASQTTAVTSASGGSNPGGSTSKHKSKSLSRSRKSLSGDWTKEVKWIGTESTSPYSTPVTTDRAWTHLPSSSTTTLSTLADVKEISPARRSLDSLQSSVRSGRSSQQPLSRSNSSGSGSGTVPRQRPTRNSRSRMPATLLDAEAMMKRMSAVLEEDDNGDIIGVASSYRSPQRGIGYQARSNSTPSRPEQELERAMSIVSRSSRTSKYSTVELPSRPTTQDGDVTYQNGFNSLTLPRAAYDPSKGPSLLKGSIDLTLSGKAQVTMGTISIIRGGSTASKPPTRRSNSFSARVRRLSWSSSKAPVEAPTPAHLQSGLHTALAFTTTTSTPSKFGQSQMIVKVHAVAIGELDRLLVKSKVQSAKPAEGYGFIPGRSFVGQVLESGWEVNDVKRGDWVMGLLEFGKSGGLAEHVVVDRSRVSRAPQPGVETWFGSRRLSAEQIASLPLFAVPAHRAVKTLPYVTGGAGKRFRVLVLGAHTCTGSMVVQELSLREDLTVSGQFLPGWRNVVGEESDDILIGEARAILDSLPEGAYLMVVDCVGGEEIWQAAKRILDPRCGQFTTLMGETPDVVPTRSAYTKSSRRSLIHAFKSSGGKNINYEWISPVVDLDRDGDNIRATLDEVGRLAAEGVIYPPVLRGIAFENGMEAFKEDEGADCVVRVVG